MSAPVTHDPRFVNTMNGACWERRAVTSLGRGLYAAAGSCKCPEFLLVPLSELAELGITGSADALPMPVVPEPQAPPVVLSEAQVEALAAAGNRVVNDETHEHLCMCDAWPKGCVSTGHYFMGAWDVDGLEAALPAVLGLWESMRGGELEKLRARVTELEAERHSTNEALDGAVQALRAKERPGDSYPPALPWARLMDDDDRAMFLDELAESATVHASSDVVLNGVEETCATWRLVAEAQHGHNTAPGPDRMTATFVPVASLREPEGEHWAAVHHDYRVPHDLPDVPQRADRVVAYRFIAGRLLRCVAHGPSTPTAAESWFPVTAEDLPDGGVCSHHGCGRDVLIDLPETGGDGRG